MGDDDYQFRFERIEVWQRAADVAFALGNVADQLATGHLYRFAEQLRAAALSISNNIAEGSGIRQMSFGTFSTLLVGQHSSAQACC
jgi:hypothetical protein